MLDRIPILLPPILRPSHNLDYRIESSWKCYYDLDKISIHVRYDGLAARFFKNRVISGGDFKYIEYDESQRLNFARGEFAQIAAHRRISLRKNRRYKLIARADAFNAEWTNWRCRWPDYWWNKVRYPRHRNINLNRPWVRRLLMSLPRSLHYRYWPVCIVHLPVAQDIKTAAQDVIAVLGEKYYALHIRRGEFAEGIPAIDKATSPQAILDRLQTFLPQGATLYIMTDEREPRYFDLLREHYRVYQYFDFPHLRACTDVSPPDNYKLFMIECEVRGGAHQAIETIKVGAAPEGRAKRSSDSPEREQRVAYLMEGYRSKFKLRSK